MNWDAIGAIGQMLGSVTVFVTLGYLAVQVKHARQETRRALSQGRGDGFRDMMAYEIDPRLSGIPLNASATVGWEMPPRMAAVMERHMFDGAVRNAYGRPGPSRLCYEELFKGVAHPDAVRYVESLLAQPA